MHSHWLCPQAAQLTERSEWAWVEKLDFPISAQTLFQTKKVEKWNCHWWTFCLVYLLFIYRQFFFYGTASLKTLAHLPSCQDNLAVLRHQDHSSYPLLRQSITVSWLALKRTSTCEVSVKPVHSAADMGAFNTGVFSTWQYHFLFSLERKLEQQDWHNNKTVHSHLCAFILVFYWSS